MLGGGGRIPFAPGIGGCIIPTGGLAIAGGGPRIGTGPRIGGPIPGPPIPTPLPGPARPAGA